MAGGAGANRARQSYNEDSGRTDQPQQHSNMSGQGGPAPYDGPASQTSSQHGDQSRQNPFPPGLGYDPAKPATAKPSIITNTRVELPVAAYALDTNVDPSSLPQRPGTSTAGKAVQIRVNQFKVIQWPTKDVYQYDVLIGGGDEKRGKILKVWNSKTLQGKLRALTGGMPWLWDGNKIAWTSYNVPEQRCLVNLDAEQGRQPRASGPDEVFCIIRPTKPLRMACLGAYLNKQMQFDNSVLESINFLDHLMRMGPSQTLLSFKRSFFARGQERCSLDKCIDAMRGVYASIRLCSPKPSVGGPATGLAVNVDVANGTFWAAQDLHQAARNLCKSRNRGLSYQVFQNLLRPTKDKRGDITMSEDFKELRKLTKLKFWVKHRGKAESEKEYTILKFTFSKDEQFFEEGVHSRNFIFKMTDTSTNPPTERDISVYDYFRHKYNIRLEFPYLPLVQTSRAGVFPMEVCVIKPYQKYAYKLDSEQTSAMIKFAVTRPKERLKAIAQGVGMLKWHEDSYLSHYGLRVDPNLTVTQARILPPPEVQYNGSIAKPGFSGRWDLRGKKFLYPNKNPLQSWGVCVIGECVQEAALKHFVQVLVQTYISHGGRVTNKNPHLFIPQKVTNDNLGKAIDVFHTAVGQICKATPQILLFVVPLRDSFLYERLKKNSECRFAQFSQVLNKNHVIQASPQYCSNVCMKLNAKLGGTSCRVADVRPPKPFFNRPTMIIGADVSHPTPGSPQGSMAAITMSWDREACRYAAAVQTNGYRVEMITPANIKTIFMTLYDRWVSDIGGGNGPQHIYYFRDGVSEGQYLHVLKQEVNEMKSAISQKFPQHNIRWTVTICTKRHHIRFFPKEGDSSAGDRNNNPLPGTLVEHDVTHPFEYDFYLCSHVAIQGTARPVHYHVILDEANVPVNDFQRLIYNMCYQYMRSTTPVSLFPAVYYAHLASNRARAHENRAASEGAAGGQKFEERRQDTRGRQQFSGSNTGSGSQLAEPLPLMPMGDFNIPAQKELIRPLRLGMWYI